MKSWYVALLFVVGIGGCGSGPAAPYPVTKSLYLNKKLTKFVMDNGVPYRETVLANGGKRHYWRSDFARLITFGREWRDSSTDYCEVVLETDEKSVIRKIFIIERSVECGGVLK